MIRQNALLRLQEKLLARMEELRKLLAEESTYRSEFNGPDGSGDDADCAFDAGSDEISSRLVELDVRELRKVESVLTRMQKGIYGVCEGGGAKCQGKISIARLKALPCATFCINCEREMELAKASQGQGAENADDWAQVYYFQTSKEDSRINVSKMERNLVNIWRD